MSQTNRNSIRKLTLAAVFMALAIVLTRFLSINVAVFRFGFGMVPVHLAGYLLGPFWGALTGLLADLIGLMINAGDAAPGHYLHDCNARFPGRNGRVLE